MFGRKNETHYTGYGQLYADKLMAKSVALECELSKRRLKTKALEMAIAANPGGSSESLVNDAKVFEAYLDAEDKQTQT